MRFYVTIKWALSPCQVCRLRSHPFLARVGTGHGGPVFAPQKIISKATAFEITLFPRAGGFLAQPANIMLARGVVAVTGAWKGWAERLRCSGAVPYRRLDEPHSWSHAPFGVNRPGVSYWGVDAG